MEREILGVITSVLILVRHLRLAESIGITSKGRRNLETSRSMLQTGIGISFLSVTKQRERQSRDPELFAVAFE